MEKHQPVILYSAIFLLAVLILKMAGLVNVSSLEILAYLFIIFGIAYVYASFGKNRKGLLFTASSVFLVGILIYLFNNFEFFAPSRLIYPSILFIAGIGFFMIFIDGDVSYVYLIISAVLILMGLVLVIIKGDFGGSFFLTVVAVASKYWIIIVITIIVFVLMAIQERRR